MTDLETLQEQVRSLSTQEESVRHVARIRATLGEIVKRMTDQAMWDNIKSRDVPPELVEFVSREMEKGKDPYDIRRDLGITSSAAKSWQKITSAIKMGVRIDGTALLKRKAWEYQLLSEDLRKQIKSAIEDGVPQLTKDGDIVYLKGPTKELGLLIDTYNRLSLGFVKLGKDLGAFVEGEGKGGSQGVTIVVNTMVPLPAQKDVDAHVETEREKAKALLDQVIDVPVGQIKP